MRIDQWPVGKRAVGIVLVALLLANMTAMPGMAASSQSPKMSSLNCDMERSERHENVTCTFHGEAQGPVYYVLDWGDGVYTRHPLNGYVQADETMTAQHDWERYGDYTIRATIIEQGPQPRSDSRATAHSVSWGGMCALKIESRLLVGATHPDEREIEGVNTHTLRNIDPHCGGERFRLETARDSDDYNVCWFDYLVRPLGCHDLAGGEAGRIPHGTKVAKIQFTSGAGSGFTLRQVLDDEVATECQIAQDTQLLLGTRTIFGANVIVREEIGIRGVNSWSILELSQNCRGNHYTVDVGDNDDYGYCWYDAYGNAFDCDIGNGPTTFHVPAGAYNLNFEYRSGVGGSYSFRPATADEASSN